MTRFRYFWLRRLSGRVFWAFIGLAILMLVTGIGAYWLLSLADEANKEQLVRNRQAAGARQIATFFNNQRDTLNLTNRFNLPLDLRYLEAANAQTQAVLAETKPNFPASDPASNSYLRLENLYLPLTRLIKDNSNRSLSIDEQRTLSQTFRTTYDTLATNAEAFKRDREAAESGAALKYSGLIGTIRQLYLFGSFGLFILGVFLAAVLARTLALPLLRLAKGLNQVAAGDLTELLEISGAEELANLSITFNRTMANLKLAIVRIQTQAATIAQTTNQIIEASNKQAQRLAEQAIAVTGVSVTVAELSETGQQIAASAQEVAGRVDQSREKASQGLETMLVARDIMTDMRHKIQLIFDRIEDLNQVARHIRQITLLIDTLSNDTHLLALNASIESAGTEQENERFSTVASQVRQLSQRSRAAAVEIQRLVNQTQQSAAASVTVTRQGIEVVDRGEKLVSDNLATTENIINQINQTTQLTQAISQATDQQREASAQVAVNLHQISQFITNLSSNSQQFLLRANDLGDVVNYLNTIVNAFVVSPSAPVNTPEKELTPPVKTYDTSLTTSIQGEVR